MCLQNSSKNDRQDYEHNLNLIDQRLKELEDLNKKKMKQIIAMKLQASAMKYQIKKYRTEENGNLEFYIKQNDELKFQISMLKKFRNDEIDHMDSENIDMVASLWPQAEIDNGISVFTLDENDFSPEIGSQSDLSNNKQNEPANGDRFYSEKPLNFYDNEEDFKRMYSPRGERYTAFTHFPKETLRGINIIGGVVPFSLESRDLEPPIKTQNNSSDSILVKGAGEYAKNKLNTKKEIFQLFSNQFTKVFVDDILVKYLKTIGKQDKIDTKNLYENIAVLRSMIASYEFSSKTKDEVIIKYRARLEETQRKMEAFDSIKKKQKDLLKHKEDEVLYLIDSLKESKDEQMKLMEENNRLHIELSSREKKNQAQQPEKLPRKSFFSNITDIF